MNILIVNDDGYQSEGLQILEEQFKKLGHVYVVAPHSEQSGASSSISIKQGIVVHEQGENKWSVEGTPTDCINFALHGLQLDVDLVVSGINDGLNIGVDTIYSGTVGAALEALLNGKKAIAFSTERTNYDRAREEIDEVIDFIMSNQLLSDEYVLNVNFSNPNEKLKGIKITDLGILKFAFSYKEENSRLYNVRTFVKQELKADTDIWAYQNGYVSITPLKVGNSDRQIIDELKTKIK